MSNEIIQVPDGGEGEISELCVQVGDSVSAEDTIVVVESDKASVDIPAQKAGVINAIYVKEGDTLNKHDKLIELKTEESSIVDKKDKTPEVAVTKEPEETVTAKISSKTQQIFVPDIGAENVPVTEISVKEGESVDIDQTILVLESDKATLDIPAPYAGKIVSLKVKEGDTLNTNDLIAEIVTESKQSVTDAQNTKKSTKIETGEDTIKKVTTPETSSEEKQSTTSFAISTQQSQTIIHAGPAVRKIAREFGVNLEKVKGTGPKNRIIKCDIQLYVKTQLQRGSAESNQGTGIPKIPEQDYSQWGSITEKPLTRLKTIAAQNFQQSWLNVPHVTQFDEADITELEQFRKARKEKAAAQGIKLTPLPFIIKACSYALSQMPQFCSSLSGDGKKIILKHYINIGVAVDTPEGLLVPVIKNVNKKSIYDIAKECLELANKAKNKKLKPDEMKGGCFTISSLGSIGGTAFTPIVNAPEVAILGISKAQHKPVWNGKEFKPKLILPISLSYDHRVINGADAAHFTTLLNSLLSDIRNLLL